MANIEAAAAAGKYSIIAYLDTVEIFFPPTLKPEQRRSLERTYRLEECDNRQGYRLISNQPSEETVRRLDRIAGKYRGVLSRVDVALDITGGDPQHIRDFIIRHAILRWRRKGSSMHDVDNTTVYWVDTLTTKRIAGARICSSMLTSPAASPAKVIVVTLNSDYAEQIPFDSKVSGASVTCSPSIRRPSLTDM